MDQINRVEPGRPNECDQTVDLLRAAVPASTVPAATVPASTKTRSTTSASIENNTGARKFAASSCTFDPIGRQGNEDQMVVQRSNRNVGQSLPAREDRLPAGRLGNSQPRGQCRLIEVSIEQAPGRSLCASQASQTQSDRGRSCPRRRADQPDASLATPSALDQLRGKRVERRGSRFTQFDDFGRPEELVDLQSR